MTRITVLAIAALVGILMAFDNAGPVDDIAAGTEVVVTRAVTPETLIPAPVEQDEQVVEQREPAPALTPDLTRTTVVYRAGGNHVQTEPLLVISRDAPAGATFRSEVSTPVPDGADIWFVSGSRVNLRAGPSTGNSIVTSLTQGTATEVIAFDGSWAHLRVVETGVEGYMARRFLSQ